MDTEKQKVGKIGEDLAVKHLVKLGYVILARNYWKPWGEIDIVATKDGILHFVEVKSVSSAIAGSGPVNDRYTPEDNVHEWKMKRLLRTIETYLIEKNVSDETDWQLDIMAVFVDFQAKRARIRITEDI
ncbi:MAG: YraN family protein [Candidatus Niyogibacteria bacterium]|nr:YraN family protein [Candidatus Niyogibacteria bacterium]